MGETINRLLELIKSNTTFAIIVVLVFILAMFLSLTVIFYKIRVKAWKGLIPIYNIMTLLDVLDIPVWMLLVMLIPFVNIVGIPIMMIIIGWKLGNHCRKGILMKLGLCFLPPLFIPLLSLSYIDIDGIEYVIEEAKIPQGFSLDTVEVTDIDTGLMAMSLTDMDIMEKIAPPKATREVAIPKATTTAKKDMKDLEVGPSNNEVEDLNRILPTADDLTFDYNSLYKNNVMEETTVMPEEAESIEELKSVEEDISTLVGNDIQSSLENNEVEKIEEEASSPEELAIEAVEEIPVEEPVEEIEEEPTIVIHDVVLEAAAPITEGLGPIPINRRYDFQNQKNEVSASEIATIEAKNSTVKKIESSEISNVEKLQLENIQEEIIEELNPLSPPTMPTILDAKEDETIEELKALSSSEEKIEEPLKQNNIESPPIVPVTKENSNEVDNSLPMQAMNPFADGMLPSITDLPELTLPEIQEENREEIQPVNMTDSVMQGLRQQEVAGGTRVDQIVSMNIAEPSQLPVGILTNAPGKAKPDPKPEPDPIPVEPAPVQPQVNPNMTRAEAMGINQRFFESNMPVNQNLGNPYNQSNIAVNPPNIFMGTPVINNPQPMAQPMYNQTPNMQPQPMNYNQSGMNAMPVQQGYPQMMQQPVNTNIFQPNTPGGSLLRPVSNGVPPMEKNCPVCGVKLKPDCQICIMCGFKF